jgi:predicted ATPase
MTPEQRRQKTLEALGSQLEALSRSNSVLMIFEDAHWVDPTSLEVIIVDRLRHLRVLLIVTFRPEFDSPWIGRPYVTALTLNRLAQRDLRAGGSDLRRFIEGRPELTKAYSAPLAGEPHNLCRRTL